MDMDKTEQCRNRPYCWPWLRITWTKTKKTFSPNQKICHKCIWQKSECKKVVSKFEGFDF